MTQTPVSYNKKEDGAYVYENPNDSRYVSDNYLRSESSFLQGGQDKNHNSKSIDDFNYKFDFNWQINSIHNLKLGVDNIIHDLYYKPLYIRHTKDINLSCPLYTSDADYEG